MAALCDWVSKDAAPPASQYPHIVDLRRPADVKFPAIRGVEMARIPAQPYRVDYGPRWNEGIIDVEPPRLGAPYVVLVPKVDAVGNDDSGISSIELRAPLATYLPWHLRPRGAAGADRLMSFTGTFIPLPRTEDERRERADSRESIERRYRYARRLPGTGRHRDQGDGERARAAAAGRRRRPVTNGRDVGLDRQIEVECHRWAPVLAEGCGGYSRIWIRRLVVTPVRSGSHVGALIRGNALTRRDRHGRSEERTRLISRRAFSAAWRPPPAS